MFQECAMIMCVSVVAVIIISHQCHVSDLVLLHKLCTCTE